MRRARRKPSAPLPLEHIPANIRPEIAALRADEERIDGGIGGIHKKPPRNPQAEVREFLERIALRRAKRAR